MRAGVGTSTKGPEDADDGANPRVRVSLRLRGVTTVTPGEGTAERPTGV